MSTIIWILKILVAAIFAFTGFFKIFLSKAKLLARGMKGLNDLNEDQIKVVGLLEILGIVGLILPALINITPVISAISALCLSLIMIVAIWINYNLKLPIIPNIVIFIICILIAYWGLK